ncbi:hypothetical protein AAA173_18250 [Enterocloster aldenensis]
MGGAWEWWEWDIRSVWEGASGRPGRDTYGKSGQRTEGEYKADSKEI